MNPSQDRREIPESLVGKKPQTMKSIITQKPGPGGDVRGEGESSASDSQDPTDGSYIMDMESCNI